MCVCVCVCVCVCMCLVCRYLLSEELLELVSHVRVDLHVILCIENLWRGLESD